MSTEQTTTVPQDNMSICETDNNNTTPPSFVFSRSRGVTADDFRTFKEEMKSMIEGLLARQQDQLKSSLKEIHACNVNIENSIAVLTAQNEELTKKISQLENKTKEDRNYITLLEEKIENLQMGSRKSNLEIKNVPRWKSETKENFVEMVLSLSSSIGATLNKSDIKDVYRVRSKKKEAVNTPIIVETSSTLIKTEILRRCKLFNTTSKNKLCAKHLGHRVSEDTPVFVSEQLTAKGARLYFLARDLVKNGKYKFCWPAYGRIYVRKSENSPIITVKSEAQVQQLLNTD